MDLILGAPGKLIVTGIGKSGHIARKLVATLCSTGTPAVFLHPAEAVHGDLGVYSPGDPTLLVSNRGSSRELLALVPVLRQFRSPLIGILGSKSGPLAAQLDVLLDASVEREADPHNLMPTASAVTALAVGHALAIALMCARNFTPEEFGRYHPGGQLGRNLRLQSARRCTPATRWPWWRRRAPEGRDHRHDETAHGRGVRSGGGRHAGGIPHRRRPAPRADRARRHPHELRAADAMTPPPMTVGPEATLGQALELMERRRSQISVLPVVDGEGRALGVLRLHDVYLGTRG